MARPTSVDTIPTPAKSSTEARSTTLRTASAADTATCVTRPASTTMVSASRRPGCVVEIAIGQLVLLDTKI